MTKHTFWGITGGLSFFAAVVGYWTKITHQAYADTVLTIGMWALAVSGGVYVYLKFSSIKNKN